MTVPTRESGFRVMGQARDMVLLDAARYSLLVTVTRNDDSPQLFRVK